MGAIPEQGFLLTLPGIKDQIRIRAIELYPIALIIQHLIVSELLKFVQFRVHLSLPPEAIRQPKYMRKNCPAPSQSSIRGTSMLPRLIHQTALSS